MPKIRTIESSHIVKTLGRVYDTLNAKHLDRTTWNFLRQLEDIESIDLLTARKHYTPHILAREINESEDAMHPKRFTESPYLKLYGKRYCESKYQTLRAIWEMSRAFLRDNPEIVNKM